MVDRWITTLSRADAIALATKVNRIGPNTAEKAAAIDSIIGECWSSVTLAVVDDIAALLPLHGGRVTARVISEMIDAVPEQMRYVNGTTIVHIAVLHGRWSHLTGIVCVTGGSILSVCAPIDASTPISICSPGDLPALATAVVNAWHVSGDDHIINGTHMREMTAGAKMFGSYVVDAMCANGKSSIADAYRAARAGRADSVGRGGSLAIHLPDIIDNADKYPTLDCRIALIGITDRILRAATLSYMIGAAIRRHEPAALIAALLNGIDRMFVAAACDATRTVAQVIAYGDEEAACAFVAAGVDCNITLKGQNMLERACRARMRVLARSIIAQCSRPQPLSSVVMWITMMDSSDMATIIAYVAPGDVAAILGGGYLPANAPAAAGANHERVCALLRA